MTVKKAVEDALLLGRYAIASAEAIAELGAATAIGPLNRTMSRELFVRWAKRQRARFGITVNRIDNSGVDYRSPPYVFVQLNQTTLAETGKTIERRAPLALQEGPQHSRNRDAGDDRPVRASWGARAHAAWRMALALGRRRNRVPSRDCHQGTHAERSQRRDHKAALSC